MCYRDLTHIIGYHYNDVIMGAIASQITSLTIVYSIVYFDADQRKHQSSASLAFVLGIHRGPVNSPHKWPVTRKMFPFDDVIIPMERLSKIYRLAGIKIPMIKLKRSHDLGMDLPIMRIFIPGKTVLIVRRDPG